MSIDTAWIENPDLRFTITEIGGKDLRKYMSLARFMSKRGEYIGRVGIRVIVTNMKTSETQTWNLALNKWFA